MRVDYIFILFYKELTTSAKLTNFRLLPSGIVVELSPVRGLVADHPISTIFKPSRSCLFHHHVVANTALRVFQQFNQFVIYPHFCDENQWKFLVLQFHSPLLSFEFAIINPAPHSIIALEPSAARNIIFPFSSVYQFDTVDRNCVFSTSICPFSLSVNSVPFCEIAFARSYSAFFCSIRSAIWLILPSSDPRSFPVSEIS